MEDHVNNIVSESIGNSEELKKDVVEAARAGIKKEITEYFTGYSSPLFTCQSGSYPESVLTHPNG